MTVDLWTRRKFLSTSGTSAAAGMLLTRWPLLAATAELACRDAATDAPFVVLTEAEAALADDLAAEIVPSDDTPGAREARAVRFIDRALESFAGDRLESIRGGLEQVRTLTEEIRSDADFGALSASERAAVMGRIESTPFFADLYFLTMAGMLSHPRHGGNQDKIGWRMMGFDDTHVWRHPFGFYDGEAGGEVNE